MVQYSKLVGKNWFIKKYKGLEFQAQEGEQVDTIAIPVWKFWKERLKATYHFVRNRSQFTDYLVAIYTYIFRSYLLPFR